MGSQLLVQLATARRQKHAEPLALHIAGEKLSNFGVVIDDEDSGSHCHECVFYRPPDIATRAIL